MAAACRPDSRWAFDLAAKSRYLHNQRPVRQLAMQDASICHQYVETAT
jgi:hypothetical protein